MERKVNIEIDSFGNRVVVIKEIFFRGRQHINWGHVETYLRRYCGNMMRTEQSNDSIYIGTDFADEYTGSKYTARLKGTAAKAKANAAQGIPELVRIAINRQFQINLADKHKNDAKYGWYRYHSRFALPVCNENGTLDHYNCFSAELVVRHASDDKLYLYDIVKIKKETGTPL